MSAAAPRTAAVRVVLALAPATRVAMAVDRGSASAFGPHARKGKVTARFLRRCGSGQTEGGVVYDAVFADDRIDEVRAPPSRTARPT
jgi:hypothetical protein